MWLDCDVIQADGGTRTASITGAYVALALAMQRMVAAGILKTIPLTDSVAATSVGLVEGDRAAGPGLRGRLPRRSGHERGDDRRRKIRRSSGHRRRAAVRGRAIPGSAGAGGRGNPPGYRDVNPHWCKPISVPAQSKPLHLFVASSNPKASCANIARWPRRRGRPIKLALIPNFEEVPAFEGSGAHLRRKCRGEGAALQPIFARAGDRG